MRIQNQTLVMILGFGIALGGCSKKRNPKKSVVVATVPEVKTQPKTIEIEPVQPEITAETEVIVPPNEVETLPTTYEALMKEGRVLLNKKDSKVVDYFSAAVEMRPKRAFPKVQNARALLLVNRVEEAFTLVEEALDMNPGLSLGWNTLGRIHLAKDDGTSAISAFSKAVEEDAENSYAWNNLGYTLLLRGDYQAAAEALEEATSGNNVTQYMWNNLGLAYEHLDLIPDARSAYRQAAETGSGKAQASLERLRGVVSVSTVPTGESEDFDTFH